MYCDFSIRYVCASMTPVLIGGESLALNQFDCQVLQHGVVELKVPLEGATRDALALMEEHDNLALI